MQDTPLPKQALNSWTFTCYRSRQSILTIIAFKNNLQNTLFTYLNMSLLVLTFLKSKCQGAWALIRVGRRQEQIVFNIRQECYLGLSSQPEVLWHFFLTYLKYFYFPLLLQSQALSQLKRHIIYLLNISMNSTLKDLTTSPSLRKHKQLYKEWIFFLNHTNKKWKTKACISLYQKSTYKLWPFFYIYK